MLLCAGACALRAARLNREIADERETNARDGEVSRGLRAIRPRLLEREARLREIGLRRDPFAQANLIDRVGALRLIRGSAAGVPGRFRFLELR